jgi:cytochrome c556
MTDSRSFRGSFRGLARAASALLAVLALTFAVSSVTRAQEAPPPPGVQHIKLRQATMDLVGNEFGPLIGVATGKIPYNAARAQLDSERLAVLAGIASEMFPADSQSGAPTKAKAEIWTDTATFASLVKEFQDKTAALVVASKVGTLDALKPAVFDIGKTCKGCHDKFKDK